MPRATYDEGYDDGYEDGLSESGNRTIDSDVIEIVESNLSKIRMGYDTPTLREVLEEMERIIHYG